MEKFEEETVNESVKRKIPEGVPIILASIFLERYCLKAFCCKFLKAYDKEFP